MIDDGVNAMHVKMFIVSPLLKKNKNLYISKIFYINNYIVCNAHTVYIEIIEYR